MKSRFDRSCKRAGVLVTLAFLLILVCGISARAEDGPDNEEPSESPSVSAEPSENPAQTATPVPTPTPCPPGQATLRIMYTTDTHGQVTNYDYQMNKETTRGLNRISTMIKDAKAEMGNRNCLLFDVGDNIMDYSTDFIYNSNPDVTQPVYKALAFLNYDAITLGNHEFDYGVDYATEQLTSSGLWDKVVLSNVTSKFTGAPVYGQKHRILEKEVVDSNGNTRIVKIGLFGVTPTTLSKRNENVFNSLSSEDMLITAEKEVSELKEMGADIIIALAHTGVGSVHPEEKAGNVGYAMTKIQGIDVILGGHQHVNYPDSKYSYLPGIDFSNWLTNGTRLLVMRDSARSLGIADLNLSFDAEGKLTLSHGGYELRKVTASVTPDPDITAFMKSWNKKILAYSSQVLGTIGQDRWTAYLAALKNNKILQTVQNAQRCYAYQYICAHAPQYKDYPILCATRYGLYGNESGSEYGDVTGAITCGNTMNFARYHQYIYVYEVTGAQLKEWIEWSASVYQQIGTSQTTGWDDPTVARYISESRGDSLLSNENLTRWTTMFRFGGVEYTMDPTYPARYTHEGTKISDSERVTSLTMNGIPITPDQVFVIASDQILPTLQTEATSGIYSHKIASDKVLLQDVVNSYLVSRAGLGVITMNESQNWKLKIPAGKHFLLTTGTAGDSIVRTSPWYRSLYDSNNGYSYYDCVAPREETGDKEAPCLALVPSSYSTSDQPVTVRVLTNDTSGIADLQYVNGTRAADDPDWHNGFLSIPLTENAFTVTTNGIYTVYVKDGAGNEIVQSIAINNIDPQVLRAPTIHRVDNNDKKITGTAQAGTTIHIEIGDNDYSDKVDVNGNYLIKIPVQKAKKKIAAFVTDSKDRASIAITTRVKRVCPNCPSAVAKNNSYYVTGKTNDTDSKIFAYIGKKVYLSKSLGKEYYKLSKKYNKKKAIVKTEISISRKGTYKIKIPHFNSGKRIRVYSVDRFGRVSTARDIKVKHTTFNPLKSYRSYARERTVYGRIKEGKKGYVIVCYADGSRAGAAYSDKNGYYAVPVNRSLKEGEKLILYGKKNSETDVKSHPGSGHVVSLSEAEYDEDDLIKIRKITAADTRITGETYIPGAYITILSDTVNKTRNADNKGEFSISLPEKQDINTRITVLVRSAHGVFYIRRYKTVVEAPPPAPTIKKVNLKLREIRIWDKKLVTVRLKIEKKLYTKPTTVYYKKADKRYVYVFKIKKKFKDGMKLIAIAKNKGGTTRSKPYTIKLPEKEKRKGKP